MESLRFQQINNCRTSRVLDSDQIRDDVTLVFLSILLFNNTYTYIYLFLLLFSFAGYVTRGCSQPEAVNLTLKVLVSAAPICLMIVGLVILYFYPIDEKRRQHNRDELRKQR